jgi:hypothetical protein
MSKIKRGAAFGFSCLIAGLTITTGPAQAPFVTAWLTKIKDQRLQLKDEASAKAADDAIKAINANN